MAEKADITMDEARALVADTALWPLVRDFLWDFSAQIHRSWIEGLELLAPLNLDSQSILENPRVKRFVLERLGVEPCMHTFPKDDWSRLLLLGGDTLIAIAKWLGALACADALRRVTDGKVVRELKAGLSGVYPEVFTYVAYFSGIDFQRRDAEAQSLGSHDVISAGVSVLFSLLEHLPSPLASRLKLKLPKDLCDSASLRLKQEACGRVLAKLLKLKFPEAYLLCC